jgi:hypothetical protein
MIMLRSRIEQPRRNLIEHLVVARAPPLLTTASENAALGDPADPRTGSAA